MKIFNWLKYTSQRYTKRILCACMYSLELDVFIWTVTHGYPERGILTWAQTKKKYLGTHS
jgi:hypothetical protein